MTDRDALLAAILADPDDDTPRLVYADWLQENGEEDRAEFIRVQCRLEHVPRGSAEGRRLTAREKELLGKLFGHLDALRFESVSFRRGFVWSVTSGLRNFRNRASELRPEDAPAYELVLRHDAEDERVGEGPGGYDAEIDLAGQIAALPELRRCVSLDLPCLGMSPGEQFLDSKQLVNLRRLNFPENEAGPTVELVASPTFANLRWANFRNSDSAADCPSIVPLAECPHLANLEHLDFGECEQWDECAAAVANCPYWDRLRYLSLATSQFSPDALRLLLGTTRLPALAELDLSHTFGDFLTQGGAGQGDPFAAVIADSPLFARLAKLWLRGDGITDAGAKALAATPRECRLELVDLTGNPITAAGRRALARRFGTGVCVFEVAGDD